ncbi:hypothetical protein NQ317_000721, partial [Molorchus minor]
GKSDLLQNLTRYVLIIIWSPESSTAQPQLNPQFLIPLLHPRKPSDSYATGTRSPTSIALLFLARKNDPLVMRYIIYRLDYLEALLLILVVLQTPGHRHHYWLFYWNNKVISIESDNCI